VVQRRKTITINIRFAVIPQRIVLWGAVGQARLIGEVVKARGSETVAVFEENERLPIPFPDLHLFRNWQQFDGSSSMIGPKNGKSPSWDSPLVST
jgi:hypothetical protein